MATSGYWYASTFIAGFGEIVQSALVRTLASVRIETLLDGLVLYRSTSAAKAVQQLRFFNNSYLVLHSERCSPTQATESIVQRLFDRAKLANVLPLLAAHRIRTFRIIVAKENTTVSIAPPLLARLEKTIARQLKLTVSRALPDAELWFLQRSEGVCLFGLRLTALGNQRTRKYERGELRQELAHLLCLLSDPKGTDIVLEPFCGSGAIVLERAEQFPVQQILAGDHDAQLAAALRRRTSRNAKIMVAQWDALHLSSVDTGAVSKIITDPPWGFFQEQTLDFEQFYREMLVEFARVLQPAGIAVILIGRKFDFEQAVQAMAGQFDLVQKYDVLVSGKKAGVYKLVRRNVAEVEPA